LKLRDVLRSDSINFVFGFVAPNSQAMVHTVALHLALWWLGSSAKMQSTGEVQVEQRPGNRGNVKQDPVCDVSDKDCSDDLFHGKALLTQRLAVAVDSSDRLGHGSNKNGIQVYPHSLSSGAWGDFWDLWDVKIKNAYMAYIGEKPSSIEYIALFIAGQQKMVDGRKTPSITSGAVDGDYASDTMIPIDPLSMSGLFFDCKDGFCFDKAKTLQLSIFDAQFEWEHSKERKRKMLDGYVDFLLDKINGKEGNVKVIYLAGASRGGCLVARMAQSLMAVEALKTTKFIVQSFDGVCNQNQEEFGTKDDSDKKIVNPLCRSDDCGSSWFAWRTNIKKQFESDDYERLCMRHVVGGKQVIVGFAHAFSHKSCSTIDCTLTTDNGWKWYEQTWVKLKHGVITGDDADTLHMHDDEVVDPMIQHFMQCKQKFDP